MSPSVLIIGGTRGLGAALVQQYHTKSVPGKTVYATTRSSSGPESKDFSEDVRWLTGVDLMKPSVGDDVVRLLGGSGPLESVIITAGVFHTEEFTTDSTSTNQPKDNDKNKNKNSGINWDSQLQMYTTSSIAPVFIIQRLTTAGLLQPGSKVILVSSESGSITLRHESEGGGNFGHHASKAALNMVGKLLSLNLRAKEVVVSIVHPGFMRTEMTRGVGFDKFWEDGGAVTPDVAAKSLVEWIDKLDISKTGQYWAPRGPGDIGTAPQVLGEHLSTPLQLPW